MLFDDRIDLGVGLVRMHPVVVWPGVLLRTRADERQMFDARHVVRIGAVQVAAGVFFLVQLNQRSVRRHFADQPLVFRLTSVAPVHTIRLREPCDFVNPVVQFGELAAHSVQTF